jgi:hypothetical protein
MRAMEPIFVTPRSVQRDWGRDDPGPWCRSVGRAAGHTGEAWVHDAANATDGGPLGRRLAANASEMLGDLGRAPPRLRMIFPDRPITLKSTAPVSFWMMLEPGSDPAPANDVFHRSGARIRAYEGAEVALPAGSVALEVSPAFQPGNEADDQPSIIRMPPVSNRTRATLFREAAFSVESWMLPAWSRLVPDGQTCHVVMALTPGVGIDGHRLYPGEAVFLPAWGRPVDMTGGRVGAKALVAYPSQAPTAIWRHTPGPDPMGGLLPRPEPVAPRLEAAARAVEPALAA